MELTKPASVAEVRDLTDLVQGWTDGRIELRLELTEAQLREQFNVVATTEAANAAMRRAILLGFESHYHQTRQVASENASSEGYSMTLARTGVLAITWPDGVLTALAPFMVQSEETPVVYGPRSTDLVRT